MAGIARWGVRGAALGMGALWWWSLLRLAAVPGAGVLEAAVAAGGWGLSVLPVHCVPKRQARAVVGTGRWRRIWGAGVRRGGVTTASPRPRSGGGSGPW
jgi:hypothetical protein